MSKSMLVVAAALTLGLTGLSVPSQTAHAKTTYLPKAIRHHTFYRLTSGTEGGFHDKTRFKGNKMLMSSKLSGHWTWRLSNVKRHSAKVYYAKLHYSKKSSERIKIKIFNKKHFDFIPKHVFHIKGNYKGNEAYGAMIFKR